MIFTSLHQHTTYSFLDGFGTPEQHILRAAEIGYGAIAFTEHGNTSSHFRAEKAAIKLREEKGIWVKPIFGIEAYTAASNAEPQQTKFHLTVLAATQAGYRNLNMLVTKSWKNYYYHPTMTGQEVSDYGDGLIILSGCSGSYMACTLIGGKGIPEPRKPNIEAVGGIAERFSGLFPGRFYLEVQAFPELENTCKINKAYGYLSRVTGIPLAATVDAHYPRPEDNEMQVILHACGPQGRGKASADEMLRRWNYDVLLTIPDSDKKLAKRLIDTGLTRDQAWEAIDNTSIIASQCNVTLPKASRLRYPIREEDWASW
jgi:DNA polymerase III subunit alpha